MLGDKWRQVAENCEQSAQSIQCAEKHVGVKWEIRNRETRVAGDNSERTGREILRTTPLTSPKQNGKPGDKRETSLKSCGRGIQSARGPEHSVLGIMRAEKSESSGRNTSLETNVKSCGPNAHPFQRSKDPTTLRRRSGSSRGR